MRSVGVVTGPVAPMVVSAQKLVLNFWLTSVIQFNRKKDPQIQADDDGCPIKITMSAGLAAYWHCSV
jgi:hypothetical protein